MSTARLQARRESPAPSIQAGAGTGKTTRVVRLLLDRLLSTDTEPSRLLALSFTVRAANEMRDRLGSWLSRLVDGHSIRELGGDLSLFDHPERARQRGLRALGELDRIEIGTIHSFAAHLLRQYPVEAGVSPSFTEDEGGGQDAVFRDLWPRWLDARLREHAGRDRLAALLERCEMTDLSELAATLCREEDPANPLPAPDAERERQWARRLHDAATEAEQLLASHAAIGGRRQERILEALRYLVQLFRAPAVTRDLRRRRALLKQEWPSARDWRAAANRYKALRQFAQAVLDCDDERIGVILTWLRPFTSAFQAECARRGLVSFHGLLVRAAELLRDNVDIRDHLKRRFHLLIVDEFQDTDPLQGEILLFLAERQDRSAADSRLVEVEPGKLVIVGDEKQSIYLFRGADLEAYQAIAERLTAGREEHIERLSTNYRSRRELVRFVNAIGRRTMQMPAYVPIDPSAAAATQGTIEMILFPELDAGEARESEAHSIAGWVAAGIRAGEFRAGDVALLLRTLGFAELYTSALRQHGVDFVIEGEKHFYAAQEVLDLLNLLSVIVDPMDEAALVGLLRSPLGGVRDRELVILHEAHALGATNRERVPDALSHVRDLYTELTRFYERARLVPASLVMREILDAFPILELARASTRGQQAVANVRKLSEEIGQGTGHTLALALQEHRRRARERTEEGEAGLGDEGLDAVRILSIHRAKGLEFPVVALADLHREAPGSEDRLRLREWLSGRVGLRCGSICSRDWITAAERYRRIQEEEERRVLYVALTRAKDRLLLTGGKPDKGLLRLIVSALAAEGAPLGPERDQTLVGDGFAVTVRLRERTEAPIGGRRRLAPRSPESYAAEQKRWAARHREKEKVERTALLAHPSVTRVEAIPRTDDEICRADRLEQDDDAAGGRSVGSRCHDVLATVDLAAPQCPPGDEEVRSVLEPFFASEAFAEIRRAERVYRELPFVIRLDDTVWSGQLDVLYQVDGRWIVADYKSHREEHPEHYRTQARVYARATQRALGLPEAPEFRLIYLRSGRVRHVPT